ncbi:MAG: TonB-dependent receptor [Pseudomonadota bacterium]|nr:TonB-dependent receptor [Pseudomonadota bacterium]
MSHSRWNRIFLVTLVLTAPPVRAEDLFDMSLESLMSINITSTSYFDQTLLESASSVSYGDQDRWDELGTRNLGEWLNTLPSTVATPGYGKTRVIAIRGYYNYSIDTGVATLLDDVPINTLRYGTGSQSIDGFDLTALESVEVIRGPASSLYGSDAFHGVLSMNTAQHGDTGITTRLGAGSEDEQAASLVGRFHQDRHHLTAALAYRNIGDQDLEYPYQDPASGKPETGHRRNSLENQNLVLKYQLDASAQTQYRFSGYLMSLDSDQLLGVGRRLGGDAMADQDWSDYQSRLALVKAGFEHHYNPEFSSSAFVYYWQTEDEGSIDLREAVTPFAFYQETRTEEHHWGVKAVNRHQLSRGSNLAYGYAYHQAKNDRFTVTRTLPSGASSTSDAPEQGAKDDNHSVFVDGRYNVQLFGTRDSTLVYGTRLDNYKHFDWQNSPRLGWIQPLDHQYVAKLILGRSYRKPNTFEMYGSSSVLGNMDLEPETLDSVELVLQHAGEQVFSSVTLFKNWWHDSIRVESYEVPVNGIIGQFENTDDNESWGLELEVMGEWGHWRLDANASHILSKNVDLGLDYEAFPDWMLNLGVGYRWSPQWDLYLLGRYQHRRTASEPQYGVEPHLEGDDFFRTDLTLAWSPVPNLITRLAIRNLFDRENYMPSYSDRLGGAPDNGINGALSLEWRPAD